MAKDGDRTIREAVAVYVLPGPLEEAARRLRRDGIDDERVSLLTSDNSVREHLQHLFAAADDPEGFQAREEVDDAGHGLSRGLVFTGQTAAAGALVVTAAAVGGPLLAGLAGAAAVGTAGAAAMAFIRQDDAHWLQEHLDQGHLLLCVRANGDDTDRLRRLLEPDSAETRVVELQRDDA